MHLHILHFSVPIDGLDAALKTYICNNHLKTHLWICFCIHITICIHLNPLHLNPLYLREDCCKIGGCCSFVEIDVLHCIVLHYIVSSYVSIIVSIIGKTVVKLGFAVPLRCMPRCYAAACSRVSAHDFEIHWEPVDLCISGTYFVITTAVVILHPCLNNLICV